MPKKLVEETPMQQSARFKRDTQKLIDAGDFDPAAADAALDALVRKSVKDHGA